MRDGKMIKNKEDYKIYKYNDKIALGKEYRFPKLVGDEVWKFERLMRKTEYYTNCSKGIFGKIFSKYLQYKYYKVRLKYGVSIPINTFESGLSIAHMSCITVNGHARIGKNCRIHEGVTIGATNGKIEAANIGNNVFIGSGAKIIGNVKIADNVAIGAQALVVKDIFEEGITVGGVPAKKISENSSYMNLNPLLFKQNILK